jgi:hypothetical protein
LQLERMANRLRWDRCRVCREKAVAAGGMRVLRWPLEGAGGGFCLIRRGRSSVSAG